MIYVYALTEPLDAPPAGVAGLGDAALETMAEEDVGAVFSACTGAPAPRPDSLWRHEAVTEAVMELGAALPTRFGTMVADVPRLRAVLAHNRLAVRSALEHVRGCVEVGIRVLSEQRANRPEAPEPVPAPGEPGAHARDGARRDAAGRAYLLRRLAEERGRRAPQHDGAVVDDVYTPLTRHARDAARQPSRGPGVLTAAYLVERHHLDRFVAAVRRLDAERAERQVVCTGPWPPYTFVPTLELEGSPGA